LSTSTRSKHHYINPHGFSIDIIEVIIITKIILSLILVLFIRSN